jgi:hypothetical protein
MAMFLHRKSRPIQLFFGDMQTRNRIVFDADDEGGGSDTEYQQDHGGNADDHLDRDAFIRLLRFDNRFLGLGECDFLAIGVEFRLEDTLRPQVVEDLVLSPLDCLGLFLLDNACIQFRSGVASIDVDV